MGRVRWTGLAVLTLAGCLDGQGTLAAHDPVARDAEAAPPVVGRPVPTTGDPGSPVALGDAAPGAAVPDAETPPPPDEAASPPPDEAAPPPDEAAPPPDEAAPPDAAAPDEARPADAAPPPVAAPPPDAGPPPPVGFCPPYARSPLFRPRAHSLVLGPQDDWREAIRTAPPGTDVVLRRGTYEMGDVYAVQVFADVTVRGETGNPDDVLIRGQGYGPDAEGLMIRGRGVVVADLSMTQIRNHAISVKAEDAADASVIYDVHLYDIGTQHVKATMGPNGGTHDGVVACSRIGYSPGAVRGDYINAIDVHGGVDWVIRDNYIYGIWGEGNGCEVDRDCGTYDSGPAILVWNQARGTTIERNVIVDSFRGIALGLDRGHEGGVVRNNFIYRSRHGDAGIELRSANGAIIANNTVRTDGDRGPIEVGDGQGIQLIDNLLSAPIRNRGNVQFEAHGNIENATDDDFVRPDDPHLRAGSRAIGAGVPDDDAPTDIDGDPRGPHPDVGADQHVP